MMGGLTQFIQFLKKVKLWQWILLLLAVLLLLATMFRINHLKMNDIRKEIIAADEAGDDSRITKSLQKLRSFASKHMIINIVEKNGVSVVTFGTGPIYLEHQYMRKATEALERAQLEAGDDSNPNGNVFAKAMDVCKPQAIANGWSWNSQGYLDCMTGEIAKYPVSDFIQDGVSANLPPTGMFRYDFVSPIWNFSLTGLVVILCLIIFMIVAVKIAIWCTIKIVAFLRKKSVLTP